MPLVQYTVTGSILTIFSSSSSSGSSPNYVGPQVQIVSLHMKTNFYLKMSLVIR